MEENTSILAREYITDALILLIGTKDYNKITITDICRKAGVSRMTYYRHYHSKEEIVADYFEIIRIKFAKEILKLRKTSLYQLALYAFQYYRKNNQFIVLINEPILSNIILDNFNKNFSESVFDIFQQEFDPVFEKYGVYFFAGALYNIFVQWTKSGMKETDEEMANIIIKLMFTKKEY